MTDLIGYLTGALDPEERQQIEQRLQHDAQLRDELRKLADAMAPLDEIEPTEHTPPPGLCSGVFDLIDAVESSRELNPETSAGAGGNKSHTHDANAIVNADQQPGLPQPSAGTLSGGSSRARWAVFDVVALTCVFIAASTIFATGIASSHYQARIAGCSNNLRTIGFGLGDHATVHEGRLPRIPMEGKMNFAAIYGPLLVEQEFLLTPESLICPGSELACRKSKWRQPTCRELERAIGVELVMMQRDAGGSYGYTLGYLIDGKYHPTRHEGRTHFALMADMPSAHLAARQSSNHAGRGQNVLFDDLSVRFVTCAGASCGDPFYENRHGLAAAGADHEDAVIAGGATSPLMQSLFSRP